MVSIPVLVTFEPKEGRTRVVEQCRSCGVRGANDAWVTWRAARTYGIPMACRDVRVALRCAACQQVTERFGGRAGGLPPFRDRAGSVVILSALALLIGGTVAFVAISMWQSSSDADEVRVIAAQGKVAGDAYRAKVAVCQETWRTTIAQALPDGLRDPKHPPKVAREKVAPATLPVTAFESGEPGFALTYKSANDQERRALMCEVAGGDDRVGEGSLAGVLSPAEAGRRVAEYEAKVGAFQPPAQVIVVDGECQARWCEGAAAVVTRDGRVLAYARKRDPDSSDTGLKSELLHDLESQLAADPKLK